MHINLKNIITFSFIILLSSALYLGCGEQEQKPETEPEKEVVKEEPGENEIWIQNNSFNPQELEVFINTEVTWINKDDTTTHRIISGVRPAILFDSGNIKPGDRFDFEFNDIGPVEFHCEIHPESQGDIIVKNEEVEEIIE